MVHAAINNRDIEGETVARTLSVAINQMSVNAALTIILF